MGGEGDGAVKRVALVLLNVLLALLVVAAIVATWMPAIYRSAWFRHAFPKL